MYFSPKEVYYEEAVQNYPLGIELLNRYKGLNIPLIPIESHNNIPELRQKQNTEFASLKENLIIGVRKTHKYVENEKVSDFLVPYTSSGCTAMCLYCYLVCNYNKCSYLRLFVNREQMLEKIIKTAKQSSTDLTFEIGSNSDLVLENTITGNLEWTIPEFAKAEKGYITFPTKFDMVDSLLPLDHRGRVIARVSLNPQEIINKVEYKTSSLENRIKAANLLADAGYKVGILIAPIVLIDNWKEYYKNLIELVSQTFNDNLKKQAVFEFIFMTYSFIHNAINTEAFPKAQVLLDKDMMTGRGRGKYWYKEAFRIDGEEFLREQMKKFMPRSEILYVV